MSEARFVYSSHRSLQHAQDFLEEMFASHEISEEERPLIEFYMGRWRITLPC